jgi:hypothetical protein
MRFTLRSREKSLLADQLMLFHTSFLGVLNMDVEIEVFVELKLILWEFTERLRN